MTRALLVAFVFVGLIFVWSTGCAEPPPAPSAERIQGPPVLACEAATAAQAGRWCPPAGCCRLRYESADGLALVGVRAMPCARIGGCP